MIIRPAQPADAAQIAAIWNDVIANTTVTFAADLKTLGEVSDAIQTHTFVCDNGAGSVLGFARHFAFRGGAGYRQTAEHTILLRADARGRGAGSKLMAALCDDAVTAGKHALVAAISAENPGAVAFHTAIGFERVALMPQVGFKFGRWIDLILMQKLLS